MLSSFCISMIAQVKPGSKLPGAKDLASVLHLSACLAFLASLVGVCPTDQHPIGKWRGGQRDLLTN